MIYFIKCHLIGLSILLHVILNDGVLIESLQTNVRSGLEPVQTNKGVERIYVGSYSPPDGLGKGITVLEKNETSQIYRVIGHIATESPSNLVLNKKTQFLYSVNELGNESNGLVSSFRITPTNGNLRYIQSQPSWGVQPVFITLDPSGKFLLVTNFGSSNIVVYRLNPDGRIAHVINNFTESGQGLNHSRDHGHQVVFHPQRRDIAAIPFLGLDSVYFYTFDSLTGQFTPRRAILKNNNSAPHLKAEVAPGSGPRHLVYSKNGRFFYVINAKKSTVYCFEAHYSKETGTYPVKQIVNLLPDKYSGRKWAAEIAIHPNGNFLYASERGIHHIAIFRIDPLSGWLTFVGFQPTGKIPRHFAISPLGNNMFVANEGSHTVDVFSINDENGLLELNYTIRNIPSPTYLALWSDS